MVSGRKRPLFGPSTRPLRRWKSDAEKTMSMWLKKRPPSFLAYSSKQAFCGLLIIAFPADALLSGL